MANTLGKYQSGEGCAEAQLSHPTSKRSGDSFAHGFFECRVIVALFTGYLHQRPGQGAECTITALRRDPVHYWIL
ncbi:hypothetical protein [Gordonia aichiensis]|uniref:Uncharacterized protein n=1 Tax=Gordonia aichiensis NBRC 108223 TaxID=1220583 RepID=L7KP40_9ACTN|nr:hypothetical protein [Gordonia aichiensis]GAC50389.1 hypothetical protein GOACH_24_00100 [Gordonia aichiensis NBRC 108223]